MHGHENAPNTSQHVGAALFKLALVLRHEAWKASGESGLTPTQAQILAVLPGIPGKATVSGVATALSITKGTASEAISTLERKGLLRKEPAPDDGRSMVLKRTRQGASASRHSATWPEVLAGAVDSLPESERAHLLRGLIGLIGSLQERGAVPTGRMCTECRFFRPNRYPDQARQHYCAFLERPIADTDLRVDCGEMQPVPDQERALLMRAFLNGERFKPSES